MINTGWVCGDFNSGNRIAMEKTRETIDMIQKGRINGLPTQTDSVFNFTIPKLNHLSEEENFPFKSADWSWNALNLREKFNE